ncbi:MAG: LamG domain-containing protein [Bacteroidaceae bacterium]|nr:LamG domain-containing protein [Bacteroidaceae bacterium]
MYLNPTFAAMASTNTNQKYFVFDSYNVFSIYIMPAATYGKYRIVLWMDGYQETGLTIPGDEWTHLTVVHSHDNATLDLIVTYADLTTQKRSYNNKLINWNANALKAKQIAVGNSASMTASNNFRGYMDEFRFFTKALTDTEIKRNFNHPLAGNESGLAIYYPMDEGLNQQSKAYDFSKTGGVSNERHATTRTVAESSEFIPSESQLSLMAYTDSLGYFEVRGVPFSGDGTSYSVIPELGVHEFSPANRSRYVSINSLIHNGVDFTDVSSFPVSGKVLYSGTSYPVKGVNFYVDGTICTNNGKIAESGEDGSFTISVPIGDHYIEASLNGHTFANGRYPADPDSTNQALHTFDREISNLEFRDTTLVNFTGRVVGGDIEGEKIVGFGLSKNNLGVVELVLTPTNEVPYMNAKKDDNGISYIANPDSVDVLSATDSIHSRSWRGATIDNCKKIFIHTDSLTGEFSVLVPPLEYKLDAMKVIRSGLVVGESTLIDLSNARREFSDTLYADNGSYELYKYHTSMKHAYHSPPFFTVTQEDHDDGSFGIDSYQFKDPTTNVLINDIHYIDDNGDLVYKYGSPLFVQGDPYTFLLEGYEEYINADNLSSYRVPLENVVVTIDNALSDDQAVCAVAGQVYDEEGRTLDAKAGDVVNLKSNQLKLGKDGKVRYLWKAGLPNVASPYTRSISMSFEINEKPNVWNGITGCIIGDLPTGNNFVTSGPDKLTMILRDPPGTGSSAEWSSGTVTSVAKTKNDTWSDSFDGGVTFKMGFKTESIAGTSVGPPGGQQILAATVKVESADDLTTHVLMENEGENGTTVTTTTTITEAFSTSEEPDFVGAGGDVFIGQATNVIFGNARHVGFQKVDNSGSTFDIGLKDVITTGLKFGTTFSYSQNYIENSLIPNFITLRNALLTPTTEDEINNYNPKNRLGMHNRGKDAGNLYLTTLSPGDEHFGEEGTYTVVIPRPTKERPDSVKTTAQLFQWAIKIGCCTEDKVKWYNTQIETWQKNLELNERQKVEAYERRNDKKKVKYVNHSFDGGSSYNYSIECQTDSTTAWDWTVKAGALIGNHTGNDWQGWGIDCDVEIQAMGGRHEAKDSTYSEISSFSYTLAEEGSDALTVDVYQYGAFGPIFRTRGGQTCNPYEDEVRTHYYMKNSEHPVIMEKTMQIEVPQIGVDVNTVSDIPSGSAANYTLRLSNQSEIGEDVTYRLFFLDETNPDGAELSIDGKVLTAEGRLIKVPGSQTLTKTLQLRQTQPGILRYEGCRDDENDLFGKGIGIVFASDSEPEEIADTVFIFAYFVPSSSPVELALSNTLMNTQTGSDLRLTFSGFDRNYNNLKAFRLQYKKQGSAEWTNVREYVIDPNAVGDNPNKELLPSTGPTVTYTLPMGSFTDGNYLFRCLSVCSYDNGEIYRSSEEIALVKDMMRPRPLGQPEPADGILSPGDELSVTFNENFLKGMLSQENNFKVTGVLNGADIAHHTALSMQNSEVTAQTEADINLAGKDFSIDMWVNLNGGEGTLLSHGKGSAKMSVGTDATNHLVVTIGSETYTSENAIPTEAWVFLSLSYGNGKLNATVAKDADEIELFTGKNAVAYKGNGPLTVGKHISGAIHELLLWDEAHDMTTALLNRSKTKNPSTRHLIGYWKMDEGEGTSIRDYSRNRHLRMANETWYLNNKNKALALDGQSYLMLPAYEMSYSPSDDYAVELWMRAGQQTGEAQLLQAGEVSLWLDAQGKLKLSNGKYIYGQEQQPATYDAGTISLTDNAWHHVALNVLRQGAAAVYVDGVRRLTTTASYVGSIATDNIIIGARRTVITAGSYNIFDRNLKGEIDEVRVWDATLNANKLIANRKVRLTGNEDGLVAYYPFEKNVRDQFEQLVTQGTADDMIGSGLTAQFTSLNPQSQGLEFTDEAPAMRPKPVETNVSFNYTASDTKIVIDIDEDPATIEGCTLNFTVRYLTDENGNYSEPVMWSAFVNKNQLVWAENSLSAELRQTTANTLTATVVNKGGQQQMWTLSGLPAWLEASVENGETNPLSETEVEFTILPSAPLGRNEVTVYLTGNDNIDTPLTLNIKVTGNVPDWAINPYNYESTMNVIGQLVIDNVASEDEDDILAAFIGEECRGIAQPQYNERYGGYYITMDIYGSSDENVQDVTLRAYDASTGTTYPVVLWGANNSVKFAPLSLLGAYADALQFNVQNLMEQQIELKAGWNWISFNVAAENMTVPELFKNVADDVLTVKSQGAGYLKRENGVWGGDLTGSLTNTEMYAVQMNADRKLRVIGSSVNTPINIYYGWNWIGYYGRQAASVGDALAGLTKGNGDIQKTQRGFTYWDSYDWSGSLLIMEPGLGYQLYSSVVTVSDSSAVQQSFSYPGTVTSGPRHISAVRKIQPAQASKTFTPINFRSYPDNAIMAVKLVDKGRPLSNMELGVFAGDECRAAAMTNDEGIAYLTIPGDEACELTFKVALGNEVVDVPFTLTYETDAVYGTPKHPVIINLRDTDGIFEIHDGVGNTSIYDLSGRKIDNSQSSGHRLQKGVYIINGQKRTVK